MKLPRTDGPSQFHESCNSRCEARATGRATATFAWSDELTAHPTQSMLNERNGRRTVLIAERDQNVRDLQRYFLEQAGLSVDFADDGVAALEHARGAPPAVLVTEILLPKLDGLTLCRRLRETPETRHVPIIVFSILAAATRASEAGATAFLRKPVVEAVFVPAVLDAMMAQPERTMERQ